MPREDAIATWRRAEARIYPSVMHNPTIYEQYIAVVRAIAEELSDVRREGDLVTAWHERRDLATAVIERSPPTMRAVMDMDAVRDAAFCHRHREITRERGKEIARERLEAARRAGDEWVVLFEDVTPLGSHRLEMHVRSGRALHASTQVDAERPTPNFELEVVQLDPATGAWLVDQPPLMPAQRCATEEEWHARIAQARMTFGKD
ncbi:MAG: hypothetical protein QOH72_1741 [Solirubrobacteraceae bacterium]|jgi:hypothetical protein|nr:hypothetical protein [Solirubrobacteraceae bacterium]